MPLVRGVRDDPVIPGLDDPREIGAPVMSVDGVLADLGVNELGRFAVGVAVCGIAGADVVGESVVCGVKAEGGC